MHLSHNSITRNGQNCGEIPGIHVILNNRFKKFC